MSACLRFGEFELDLAAYALRRRGEPVRLERMPMEVLILLAQRAGTLVRRTEIQAALWAPGIFVEHDAAINTAIRKVRQALGDDAERPRFVETVIGTGYRFVAPVERVAGTSRGARGTYRQSSARQRRTFPVYFVTRGRQEFDLGPGRTVLGRDPRAGVCLEHPSVSRRHACISVTTTGAVIEDLDSRNGTFLNGRRIDGPTRIEHGAIIGLGPVTLTFVVLASPSSTRSVSALQP